MMIARSQLRRQDAMEGTLVRKEVTPNVIVVASEPIYLFPVFTLNRKVAREPTWSERGDG